MLTIFSISITIYLQQLHLNLIYIDILIIISIKIEAIWDPYYTHVGRQEGVGGLLASETTSPQGSH